MQKFCVFLITFLLTVQCYGQKNDYLSLLCYFPVLPENTITASTAEIEIFSEKIDKAMDPVRRLQKEFSEQEDIIYTTADLDKIDAVTEEFDRLYKPIEEVETRLTEKLLALYPKWDEDDKALNILNAPYFEQLKSLNKKPKNAENEKVKKELLQKIYINKLATYTKLSELSNSLIREYLQEYKKLAPTVDKLDNFSMNGIKLKNPGIGLGMIEHYEKILSGYCFFFNIGDLTQSSKDIVDFLKYNDFF